MQQNFSTRPLPHFSKLLFSSLILFLSLILGACTNVRYGNDFKSETDFSPLKSYSWRGVSVDIAGIEQAALQQLADAQFAAQGFVRTHSNPDMLVDMQVFSQVSRGSNTSIGIGIGLPVGRNGSIGLGTGQTLGKGKQEGVIVIDITQATNNNLIWRGTAEGIPLINFSLKAEQALGETFTKLLRSFPPQPTGK